MEKGDLVKFKEILEAGDADLVMVVLEDRGDRVLVEALVNLPINPTYVYQTSDLVKIGHV